MSNIKMKYTFVDSTYHILMTLKPIVEYIGIPITEYFQDTCIIDKDFKLSCITHNIELDDISIAREINRGTSSVIYLGYYNLETIIVKHLEYNLIKHLENEICTQDLASKHNIAPKILSYWKCDQKNEAVIIMNYVRGETLLQTILYSNDVIKIYLNVMNKVLYQSFRLNILHGDLHLNNVIIDDQNVYIIDYGQSRIVKDISLYDISRRFVANVSDWNRLTKQFIIVLNGRKDKHVDRFLANKLNDEEKWYDILQEVYRKVDRLPNNEDLYNYLCKILLES